MGVRRGSQNWGMLEPRPLGMGGVAGQWPYRNTPIPSVILQTWSFYVKQYERNYGEVPEKLSLASLKVIGTNTD